MFNFFKPKAKQIVTDEDQDWINTNLWWLETQFGRAPFLRRPVLVTEGPWARYHNAVAEAMPYFLEEVAIHMELDPGDIALHTYGHGSADTLRGPAMIHNEGSSSLGEYHHRNSLTGKFDIHMNRSTADNLQVMLTTMAHELSHARLLGEYRHSFNDEFHEYVTDLTAIYFGFGVTMANTCNARDSWTDLHGSGWSIGRRGYLPMEVVVHTLAVQTHRRGEREPNWLNSLGRVPRKLFQQALLYLQATDNTPPAPGNRAPRN